MGFISDFFGFSEIDNILSKARNLHEDWENCPPEFTSMINQGQELKPFIDKIDEYLEPRADAGIQSGEGWSESDIAISNVRKLIFNAWKIQYYEIDRVGSKMKEDLDNGIDPSEQDIIDELQEIKDRVVSELSRINTFI